MTPLERAITAAEQELGKVEMVLTDPMTLRRMQAERVVRAVLKAVREPDEFLKEVSYQASGDAFAEAWKPMISAAIHGPICPKDGRPMTIGAGYEGVWLQCSCGHKAILNDGEGE